MKVLKNSLIVSGLFLSFSAFAQEKVNHLSPISFKENWYILLFILILFVPCFIAMQNQVKRNREMIETRKNKKLDREDEEFFYRNK